MRYLRVRRFLGLLYLALGALALVILVVVLVVAFADMSKCLIGMEGCRLANVTRALFLGEASTTLILAVFQVSPPFWIATGILGVFLVWGKCLKHLWQVVEYLLAHIRSR